MKIVSINGYWFTYQKKNAATETKNKAKYPKQVSEGPAQFKNFGSPDEDNFPYNEFSHYSLHCSNFLTNFLKLFFSFIYPKSCMFVYVKVVFSRILKWFHFHSYCWPKISSFQLSHLLTVITNIRSNCVM